VVRATRRVDARHSRIVSAVESRSRRPSAEALLKDFGTAPRLTVYLASAPGAGKTRRLLDEAIRLQESGVNVALGWIETKGRPELDQLAARLPRVPPRRVKIGESTFEDFDFAAALELRPELLILDELAHANLEGGANDKRWQDALALREAGIAVSGALNIQHVETVAATAEGLIGFPVREIVPISFLRAADQVIALDVSTEQLESRLFAGKVVRTEDIDRARRGIFRPQTLQFLREMMLRTVDDLTIPEVTANRSSTALALATGEGDTAIFLRKSAGFAHALDLALADQRDVERDLAAVETISRELDAHVIPLQTFDIAKPRFADFKASLVTVPYGPLAERIASRPSERDVLIVDPSTYKIAVARDDTLFSRYTQTAADRLRIGYGRLTIYLGAAAGSGKTYAMLDRAHQMQDAGVDVVAAFIETHKRVDTERKVEGLTLLPRREAVCDGVKTSELDLERLLARKPAVALIDELAHTNAACDAHAKRYDDVLQVLRAGISVITTVNIQHLEGLNDAVFRLTGQKVRETIPDDILKLADDLILIDTTPETLRERLRAGKIYGPEKIEDALSHFFRSENLAALRELALREVVKARGTTRRPAPFSRFVVGVKARERDVELIERCARIALRLEIDLTVVHVAKTKEASETRVVAALEEVTRRVRARWRLAIDSDASTGLIEAASAEGVTTIALEGARARSRWPVGGIPFARRLLDAGTKQLLILAPPS
jgi:two-component system sensor histidine kinase KdpD